MLGLYGLKVILLSAAAAGGSSTRSVSAGQAGRVPVARAAQDLAPAALQPSIEALSSRLAEAGIDLVLRPDCDADLDPLACLEREEPEARLLAVFGASSSTTQGIITLFCPSTHDVRRSPFPLAPETPTSPLRNMADAELMEAALEAVRDAARACDVTSARAVISGALAAGLVLDLDGSRWLRLDAVVDELSVYGLAVGTHALTAVWPDGSARAVEFDARLDRVSTLHLRPPHRSVWGTVATLVGSAGALAAGVILLVDEANDTQDFGQLPGTNPDLMRLDADGTDHRPLGVGLVAAGGTAATLELVLPRRYPWWISPVAGLLAGGIAAGLTAGVVGS